MTYAPQTYLDGRAFLRAEFRIPENALGIVGDDSHKRVGTSYHLGKDDLKMWKDPYSARLARDKAGLTNGAAAFDIGSFSKTYPNGRKVTLRTFSVWIVKQCQLGTADTRWIREVIYTDNGVRVLRYDAHRGVDSAPVAGEADDSHLWHTHVSGWRDCEHVDKTRLFKRFVAEMSGSAPVVPVPVPQPVPQPTPTTDWTVKIMAAFPELKRGSTGAYVRRLQGLLRGNGRNVEVDGTFGPGTESAVKAEQKEFGLTADGIVGKHTMSCLLLGKDIF